MDKITPEHLIKLRSLAVSTNEILFSEFEKLAGNPAEALLMVVTYDKILSTCTKTMDATKTAEFLRIVANAVDLMSTETDKIARNKE